MTRAVCLLCCGYVLLAVQLVLPGEAIRVSAASLLITGGAILWLLLPWIAAIPDRSTGVMTAAVYGLAIDCVGGLHPGLLLGSTVALTAMLQSLPWSTLLMTGPRVAASSFVCSLLPAMAVSSVSLVLRPGIVEPKTLVAGLLVVAAAGSVVSALAASLCRGVTGWTVRAKAESC